MKKSLIALAALSAFATAAQAQSSVTVYGIVDVGYTSRDSDTASTSSATITKSDIKQIQTGGEAATSRLGFRGTEDLGGGLKANFALESGIAQNTALTFGGRAFWVGLQDAKMGEIRVGRQDAFARTVWLGADQLAGANVVGNVAYDNGTPMTSSGTTSHTTRHVAVNYLSPRMNGFQLSLGVMQDDTTTTTKAKAGSGSQAGLSYAAGKFTAAAAYAEATTDTALVLPVNSNIANATTCATDGTCGADDSAGTGYKTQRTAPTAASSVKTKDTAAALTYDLGMAKVGYIYNKREATNAASSTSSLNTERTSHAFSASVPLSAKLTGRIGYGMGEYRSGAASAYTGDITGYQAALNYELSKRTMVYAIYGDEERDIAAGKTNKATEMSVGVRHSF
jgi:predicted porin